MPLSRTDRNQHIIYECALALIGALDPEEIDCLSFYTYVDALERARVLASVAVLRAGPDQPRESGGKPLSELELAEIAARLRRCPSESAAVRQVRDDAERLLQEVWRLRQSGEEPPAASA
ncbi:MAG TPA: hypothetical protein VGR27_02615 [Longimicrobiaceae bacterium]|nr:hypothetical protein [Longimicrobiaceae bacterium]